MAEAIRLANPICEQGDLNTLAIRWAPSYKMVPRNDAAELPGKETPGCEATTAKEGKL